MTDQETRIAFAERKGWIIIKKAQPWCELMAVNPDDGNHEPCPDPTDRNHVHSAMIGMSDAEWKQFARLLLSTGEGYWNGGIENVVTLILKLPLSTIVTCFLEATKGRVKS